MAKTNTSYDEAVKFASYHEVHRRVAEKMGNTEAAREAELEIHGMAKIISTIYNTWEGDDYGRAFNDIISAADKYMGRGM